MTHFWQRDICPDCDGSGGEYLTYHDEDGFEVSDWHRCTPCGGTGVKERSSGGGTLPKTPAAPLSPVSEWSRTDQRQEDMERESEEIYRREEEL